MMDLDAMYQQAMQHTHEAQFQEARQLAWQIVSAAPHHEAGWWLLAYVAQTLEERRIALWKILADNPKHPKARQAFLRSMDPPYIRQASQKGVFISYAHTDLAFVAELADDLKLMGIPVWLDMLDMAEESDWDEEVDEALKRCGLMLVVTSPGALRAENVQTEVRRFMDAGKIVLPVLKQTCDLSVLGLWHTPVDCSVDYALGLGDLMRLIGLPEPAYNGGRA